MMMTAGSAVKQWRIHRGYVLPVWRTGGLGDDISHDIDDGVL